MVLNCSDRNVVIEMNVKRRLYEGIAVATALYGSETWSIAVAEKKKLNVIEMRCLGNMCGVMRVN